MVWEHVSFPPLIAPCSSLRTLSDPASGDTQAPRPAPPAPRPLPAPRPRSAAADGARAAQDRMSEVEARWGEAWAAGLQRLARRSFAETASLDLPSMPAGAPLGARPQPPRRA